VAFSKDNRAASAPFRFLRLGPLEMSWCVFVNAGSHMHVPSVDGLNTLLVAEDGFVLPDVALALSTNKTLTAKTTVPPSGLRLQNEVFQAAGKVFDVIVSPTQTTAGDVRLQHLRRFRPLAGFVDQQPARRAGMQATLDVNDANAAKLTAANSTAAANSGHLRLCAGRHADRLRPGQGRRRQRRERVWGASFRRPPGHGTLTLYPNGTFTYAPTGNRRRLVWLLRQWNNDHLHHGHVETCLAQSGTAQRPMPTATPARSRRS